MMPTGQDFDISLEPHLVKVLQPLLRVLPDSLASQLADALDKFRPDQAIPDPDISQEERVSRAVISYQLISTISAWSRSVEGRDALATHEPPLEPHAYSMISLLAGTRTSPDKKFPKDWAPLTGNLANEAKREINDRQAVVAVLNALLSILGSGAATWWAADRLSWEDHWKVLLALFAAIVVAGSEAILYVIWSSRRTNSIHRKSPQSRRRAASTKQAAETILKLEDHETKGKSITAPNTEAAASSMQEHRNITGLRERAQHSARKGDSQGS